MTTTTARRSRGGVRRIGELPLYPVLGKLRGQRIVGSEAILGGGWVKASNALLRRRDLTPGEKLIAAILGAELPTEANGRDPVTGEATATWGTISQHRLARQLATARKTIRRQIASLEAKGVIVTHHPGVGRSLQYAFIRPARGGAPRPPLAGEGGAPRPPHGGGATSPHQERRKKKSEGEVRRRMIADVRRVAAAERVLAAEGGP